MPSPQALRALRALTRLPAAGPCTSAAKPVRFISSQTCKASRTLSTRPQVRIFTRAPVTVSRAISTTASQRNESTPLGTIGSGAADASSSISTPSTLIAPDHLNEEEAKIWKKLDEALSPTKLEVQDISGGCGSMYGIEVLSERFRGCGMLKQQRMVNEVLKEEVKGWHGVQMKTGVPKE